MADVEELIRDLLHPTKETREKAISKLIKNWNLELRPYLWKAIVNEREKPLQKRMVSIAITKLEDKSLRKMIRFIENDELYSSSINEIIRAYAEHETDEVRESLMKAILRNSHQINDFVIKLLKGRELEFMRPSRVLSLLEEIYSSDCQDEQKYQFSRAIALHPYYIEAKPYLEEGFRHKFKDIVLVRRGVLDVKFEQERDEKKKNWFIWNRTDWSKEDLPIFNTLDTYLIDSLNYRDTKLRNTVLSILGSSILSGFNFINSNQWQAIFDIWYGIYQNKLESDFIKAESYTEESLEEFFGEKLSPLYQDLRQFEIHPHQIRKLTLMLFPRSLLYIMARDDPDSKNRGVCFKSLKQYSFFFTKIEDSVRLVGSIDFVIQVLKRCLVAMQHEVDEETKQVAYELYEFIIHHTFSLYEEDLENLKTKLESLNLLSETDSQEEGYTASARILLKLYLDLPFDEENVTNMPINSTSTIVRKFVSTIEKQDSVNFLRKLLETQKTEIRMVIINEIEELFANRITISEEMKTNLEIILQLGKSDSSIKIRSYARLLLNKLQ